MKVAVLNSDFAAVAKQAAGYLNPSGIYPTEFNVLILPDDAEAETLKNFSALKGKGFVMPEESKERHQFASISGRLIAASPLAFTYENWPEGTEKPQVGDRVLIAKYCGTNFKGMDGKDYRVTKDKDVIAVLKD